MYKTVRFYIDIALLLASFSILFQSCAHVSKYGLGYNINYPLQLVISSKIEDRFVFPINDAVEYWNEELPGSVVVFSYGFRDDGKSEYILGKTLVRWCDSRDFDEYDVSDNTLGLTVMRIRGDGERKTIVASYICLNEKIKSYSESVLSNIVRHEIGHTLGLRHVEEEKCLMYPYIKTNSVVLKRICRHSKNIIHIYYDH